MRRRKASVKVKVVLCKRKKIAKLSWRNGCSRHPSQRVGSPSQAASQSHRARHGAWMMAEAATRGQVGGD